MVIYAEEYDEYFTFITPEAYVALKDWMDFRGSYGETITGESWLMRDLWQTTNQNYGARWGLATNPKKLHSIAIKSCYLAHYGNKEFVMSLHQELNVMNGKERMGIGRRLNAERNKKCGLLMLKF